jgi:peptide/nickel transport system ATP-binding protein
MMKGLREKYETSMLMISHDLGVVAEICDTVSVVYAGRAIEYGTLEDIFDHTRHPYTEGLFNSLPNLKNRKAKLRPIKGLMPDPSNLPTGCPFHPRCDYALDICSKKKPGKVYRTERHYTCCHLYNNTNISEGKMIKR